MPEDRDLLAARLDRVLAAYGERGAQRPVVVVDLSAFDANAADLERRAGGVPIRVASKSVRVPALLRRVLARDGFAGVLSYTLREALWLHATGVSDDLLVAYPTVDEPALAALAADPAAAAAITLIIDDVAHLDLVARARAAADAPATVRVALDVDAALQAGPRTLGPRRSPLRSTADVVGLARAALDRDGVDLVGAMTYEGLVAGLGDAVPGQGVRTTVLRRLQAANLAQLRRRRRRLAVALTRVGAGLELWNAGGTGSVEAAAADPVVTEVAAGSGLLAPRLFDHYRAFEPLPAAYLGLPVTRRPDATTVTVHGGGYVASGAAGADRLPTPWAPSGLELTSTEGAGEVQTPLVGPGAADLAVGDTVWFRHAKAGELMEHVDRALLLRGADVVEEAPTYRGLGQVF
ncbi:alanine racemase [uncultured Nocardioides sp.]|uniref:alanine racemase n=1 Tax=uncultured Nocardioides sp. TaxID=198441 RepID=UPI00262C542C|nr:alanine racemase [uncultured Nocardioides sp.]